eukprot:8199054-Karenia_brevis.AAC.1
MAQLRHDVTTSRGHNDADNKNGTTTKRQRHDGETTTTRRRDDDDTTITRRGHDEDMMTT